jgi:hypothetical protein
MFVCCECCVLLGRGLCDELITRPEEVAAPEKEKVGFITRDSTRRRSHERQIHRNTFIEFYNDHNMSYLLKCVPVNVVSYICRHISAHNAGHSRAGILLISARLNGLKHGTATMFQLVFVTAAHTLSS